MKLFLSFLLCLFAIHFVQASSPVDLSASIFPNGAAGNGTIWYQSDTNYPFFQFGNVKNPIQVSVIYDIGSINYDANICLNSFEEMYPISGANLESACPAGGFGLASNASTEPIVLQTQTNSLFTSRSKILNQRLTEAAAPPPDTTNEGGYTTVTTSANIWVKPSTGGAFIVTIPDSEDIQKFNVFFSGTQCTNATEYPVGSNGACTTIPVLPPSGTATVPSEGYVYYQYPVTVPINSLGITVTNVDDEIDVFIQRDYYPDKNWYLDSENQVDDDDGTITATVLTPSVGEVYFIAIYNNDDSESKTANFNFSTSTCGPNLVGFNCSHNLANTTSDPYTNVYPLSASLSKSGYNGSALSYDYSDDDYDNNYAYFVLNDYPTTFSLPYFVRVSVGNNDVGDEDGAPAFFAKQGSVPSVQSNAYNMSTVGDVAHQIVVKVDTYTPTPEETWYFAVKLPADFSIWAGANCASNCSNGDHGECYCGNDTCISVTNNYNNLEPFYTRPNSYEDSAGACTCSDDDYEQSFECSDRSNANSVLYIVLIAAGGFIVLLVAVGVPLYCFWSNKKQSNYDRVV